MTNDTEQARTDTHVVLPNLHELPADAVAEVCRRPIVNRLVHAASVVGALFSSRLRRALRTRGTLLQRHGDGTLRVLADLGAREPRLFSLSEEEFARLEQCRLEPGRVAELRARDPDVFDDFVRAGLLVTEEAALRSAQPTHIEIEINRHCNWRCVFCPVSEKPKPAHLMSEELFRALLQRAVDYGAESVALHFYGEPLMHPKAVDWIELAVASGLRVDLFTNGSLLDEEKIRRIAAVGGVHLNVNLPTVDPDEFQRVTGTKTLDRCVENLEAAHAHGVPVSLVVNAPRESGRQVVDGINARFAELFGEAVSWRTNDRAGHLDAPAYQPVAKVIPRGTAPLTPGASLSDLDESTDSPAIRRLAHDAIDTIPHESTSITGCYAEPTELSGRLSGCHLLLNQTVVSYDGKVLPCCQDYDQEWAWGDLTEDRLEDILVSEKALAFKRWVMGLEEPPEDFLCSRCDLTSRIGATGRVLKVGHHIEPPVLADADSRVFVGERVRAL